MLKLKQFFFRVLKFFFGKYYYHFLLRIMHLKSNVFKGYSLKPNIDCLNKIIEQDNIETLLDYGCGKALEYQPNPFKNKHLEIYLFDPYYLKYKKRPTKKYDLTICTDVMEHVENKNLVNVIKNISNFTSKSVFFSISTIPAKKILPDGSNAHVTLKKPDQWKEIIKSNMHQTIKIYIRFDKDKTVNIL